MKTTWGVHGEAVFSLWRFRFVKVSFQIGRHSGSAAPMYTNSCLCGCPDQGLNRTSSSLGFIQQNSSEINPSSRWRMIRCCFAGSLINRPTNWVQNNDFLLSCILIYSEWITTEPDYIDHTKSAVSQMRSTLNLEKKKALAFFFSCTLKEWNSLHLLNMMTLHASSCSVCLQKRLINELWVSKSSLQ